MAKDLPIEERARILLRQKMDGTLDRDPVRDRTLGKEVTFLVEQGYISEVETPEGLKHSITQKGREYISE
jgi:hypothetical protein